MPLVIYIYVKSTIQVKKTFSRRKKHMAHIELIYCKDRKPQRPNNMIAHLWIHKYFVLEVKQQ